MSDTVTYNPNWREENKNVCCYFCGETRSVKYTADLRNIFGERVLTVDVCNRCAPMIMHKRSNNNAKSN